VQDSFRIGELHMVEPSLNRVTGPTGSTRLEPKVMQVLVCLAEHAGDVVSKERLMTSVWTDTAVGDDVLTRAVSELRRLFADEAKHPRVIETIPKGGYRLIAPVARGQPDVGEPGPPAQQRRVRRRPLLVAAAASLAIAAGTAGWLSRRHASGVRDSPPLRVVQLTAFRGLERSPAFSPDATQIAFSWNGEREDNFDIYVRLIGSPEVRRVTTDPAPDVSPAWSPDGLQIAFVREGSPGRGGTIRVISPLGGADRRLSDIAVQGPTTWLPESAPIAWSPDGLWVAVSQHPAEPGAAVAGSLRLIRVSDGSTRLLTPATPPLRHVAPAFSPDGHRVAYASCTAGVKVGAPACDVYIEELGRDYVGAAAPRRLTNQGLAIQGLAWTRDGASIVYDTAGRGPFHLWRVAIDGAGVPERLEVAGIGSRKPAIAASRDRLAFERQLRTLSVYRLGTANEPHPNLVSTVFDFEPDFSPDGRRLAFGSFRSGTRLDIWTAAPDGSSAQQLTRGPGLRQVWPRWSPDGHQIAFESTREDGASDIMVIDADGGAPRRLTSDQGDENCPTWSRDGRWIYFSSDRGGGRDIWRVPAVGGPVERVTHGGSGRFAYEAPDGRSILYQTAAGDSSLVVQPLTGGAPRPLARCIRAEAFAVGAAGIYYSPCSDGADAAVHRLDFATGRDTPIAHVSAPFLVSDLAVAPDGRTILVHRYTEAADLMLIENFR
jgi:Tol biopolymer transport system component/DNA-binding winged helix-turn-helix (wHTH) protein